MHESKSRRALLVGAPTAGLRGVERDIERMGELLTAWDFHCETCVGPAATREGILSAIELLGATATRSTTLVLYFAGHGGQYFVGHDHANLPPLVLDYLAPMQDRLSGAYRGVLWLEVLRLLEGRSPNITMIFDCGYVMTKPRASLERVRALQMREVAWQELPVQHTSIEAMIREQHTRLRHRHHVVVTASRPGAAAFEAEIAGSVSGYLTTALCASLTTRHSPQSWETIIEKVRRRIVERRASWTQEPQVFGGKDQLPFSGPPTRVPDASSFVSTSFSPPIHIGADNDAQSVPEAEELIAGASRAITFAVKGLHDRGVSTIHLIDGELVRVDPDGSQRPVEPQAADLSR